ncbi:MAG: DUF2281 domain-containing protein [Bacteroidetes bacterium]|nr:DUF2281 domain-containing protein [Bacteroidota bacterium]
MNNHLTFNKYNTLPKNIQQEVTDFIEFLVEKYHKQVQVNVPEKEKKPKKRKSNFGSAKGLIFMSEDFDEPLEDFKDYM